VPFDKLRTRLKHIDLRWSAGRGIDVRVIEFPGRWMAPAQLQELVECLQGIVRRGIGRELDYGIVSGDIERLRQGIITLVYDKASGAPIAFNALTAMPVELRGQSTDVIHLGLVVVDPSFRAQGMSWILYGMTCILLFFRRGLRPLWISNVTQVPAIVGKVAEAFVTAYPNPSATARKSFDHVSVAREIMDKHRAVFGVGSEAGFDENRFVITNAYTGGSDNLKKTFDEAPKHRDVVVNELCRTELDYARGDDFLQIARLDLAAARKYLLREVPRDSLPALLYRLLFVVVGVAILPVLHWLRPTVAMGDLRART
jgi:hypothetical protein